MAVEVPGGLSTLIGSSPIDVIVFRLARLLRKILDPRGIGIPYILRETGVTNVVGTVVARKDERRELLGLSTTLGGVHTVGLSMDSGSTVGILVLPDSAPLFIPVSIGKALVTAEWIVKATNIAAFPNAITVYELMRT